jgi:serine acetyltransferase
MNESSESLSFLDILTRDANTLGQKVDPNASLFRRLIQIRREMRIRIGFACVFWLRVNQLFILKGWPFQTRIYMWRQYRFSNDISPYAKIGAGLLIQHPSDVIIGSSAKIGKNATIFNGVTIVGLSGYKDLPCIGDNVIVYTGAKIIKPVTIGNNVVIGAMALCNKDIPSNRMMYGIPPNVTIKPIEPQKQPT